MPFNDDHLKQASTAANSVDQLLHTLRSVEVPADLEQQVLANLQCQLQSQQQGSPPTSHRSFLLPAWLLARSWNPSRALRWGIFVPAAAALVFVAVLLSRTPQPSPAPSQPLAARALAPTTATREPATGVVHVRQPQATARLHGAQLRATQLHLVAFHKPSATTHEASYPTPTEPLTEQERLLLDVARSHDPVLIASLDPTIREAEETRSREEFEHFVTGEPQ